MKTNKLTQKRIAILGILSMALTGLSIGLQEADAATATYGVTLQTNVQEVITLSCDSATVNLGNLTPGTPVTGSSVCTGTTNANGGYTLAVKRDDSSPNTTMDKTTDAAVDITDKTDWNSGTPNSAVWSGTGLGFTVFASQATKNTTWWGTGTTVNDALNKYAGLPTTYQNIMVHTTYGAATTTSVGYKLDVPTAQKSGAYDGTITYQATSTP
jgi:hypothetical protein